MEKEEDEEEEEKEEEVAVVGCGGGEKRRTFIRIVRWKCYFAESSEDITCVVCV